jgi:hypothetical protein
MTRHSVILTNLLLSLPLATGLLCAATIASAQTSKVTIPFAFTANHEQMPIGTYEVKLQSSYFLALRNIETAKTQVVMVRPEEGRAIETQGRMVFQRDGSGSHLTQVWVAGTRFHSELTVQPKLQKSVAKNDALAGSSFEVAMK